ncbi:hypothetical protein P9E34_19730 [Schinkia azotoformans]|uniref:hypothetical protein n=1 Tax=Schinkia azotoformans TaxID=1454 RepID=UPI002DBE86DE|nr:hypothetical protein [Schinkia azotoformans]MEC1726942.1 hypothetical protein [Schinkia azotoformans]
MTFLKEKDIIRYNEEQKELRNDLPNLYNAMLQAVNGDDYNLQLHIVPKKRFIQVKGKRKANDYMTFHEPKLRSLIHKLHSKYCDNKASVSSERYGRTKLGVISSQKVFDKEEVTMMLINYLTWFPFQMIEIYEDEFIKVPSVEDFKGENDEHSNNKLLNYITNFFEMQVVLPRLNKDKNVKRRMIDGQTYYVKENDLDVVSFEDLKTPFKKSDDTNDDEPQDFTEILDARDRVHTYYKTESQEFIVNNYRDVLTKNQNEKLDTLINAVKSGMVHIDTLFKDALVLNKEAVGRILFTDKENNYRQPAVTNLLNSMRKRMDKAKAKHGIKYQLIRSDYAKFPLLPAKDNKKYKENQIEAKYIIKEYKINDLYEEVKFYKDEQVIPASEIERLRNNEITIDELFEKYMIDQDVAKQKHGAVSTYKPVDNENVDDLYILTEDEINKLFHSHCKMLLDAIRSGSITFVDDNGMKRATTDKLNPIKIEEFNILVKRPLVLMDSDNKEMDIISSNLNMSYFNVNAYYVKESKRFIIDKKSQYKYIDYNVFSRLKQSC